MSDGNMKRKSSKIGRALTPNRSKISKVNVKNESTPQTTMLTDLPIEILCKIMDFLSFDDLFQLEAVNKRLRHVVLDAAWPKIDTLNHKTIIHNRKNSLDESKKLYLTNKSMELILSRTNLKHLSISSGFAKITPEIFFHFYMAPQLISLNFNYLKLSNDYLKVIAGHCPLLEEICFQQCFDENVENGLEFLFKRCKKIIIFDLCSNDYFTGDSFANIPTGIRLLSIMESGEITSNSMNLLADRAKNLETLVLYEVDFAADINIWLRKLTKLRFINLESVYGTHPLNLSMMKDLEMLALKDIEVHIETLRSLQYCPKLKGLDLWGNRLDDTALLELKKCMALKYCDLSRCENLNNLIDLVQTCKLEALAINDCENLPEDFVKSLIRECNSLSLLQIRHTTPKSIPPLVLYEECLKRSTFIKLIIYNDVPKLPFSKLCQIISSKKNWLSLGIDSAISQNRNYIEFEEEK